MWFLTAPQVGSVYSISNLTQGTRREAHGDRSWRPHGVTQTTPDGLVSVAARGTQAAQFDSRRDFWSVRAPTIGLDKDGFFSQRDRWHKVLVVETFSNTKLTRHLGLLPDGQLHDFCEWTQQ